jgi:hypothetical protein
MADKDVRSTEQFHRHEIVLGQDSGQTIATNPRRKS